MAKGASTEKKKDKDRKYLNREGRDKYKLTIPLKDSKGPQKPGSDPGCSANRRTTMDRTDG